MEDDHHGRASACSCWPALRFPGSWFHLLHQPREESAQPCASGDIG